MIKNGAPPNHSSIFLSTVRICFSVWADVSIQRAPPSPHSDVLSLTRLVVSRCARYPCGVASQHATVRLPWRLFGSVALSVPFSVSSRRMWTWAAWHLILMHKFTSGRHLVSKRTQLHSPGWKFNVTYNHLGTFLLRKLSLSNFHWQPASQAESLDAMPRAG